MTDIDAYDDDDFGLRFDEDKPFGEDEPQSQTQKANGKHRKAEPGKEGGKPNLPEIQIVAADLERIVDEAEAALIAADRGLYQRDGDIVRIGDAKIETASSGEIVSK